MIWIVQPIKKSAAHVAFSIQLQSLPCMLRLQGSTGIGIIAFL